MANLAKAVRLGTKQRLLSGYSAINFTYFNFSFFQMKPEIAEGQLISQHKSG
jgi:hypothetical protein